jgi:hypothetical protein
MEILINLIISNLSDELLKPKYKKILNKNKYTGHCYVASEALFHLLNKNEKINYTAAYLKINGDTHWFLKNKINGNIIDITKPQFDFELDYSTSKNATFLTKLPSKRTQILLNKIYEKINLQ